MKRGFFQRLSSDDFRQESGVALVITLIAMSLLLALALALTLTTMTEVRVAAIYRDGVEAQDAAEAAVARVLPELRAAPDWTAVLNGTAKSSFVEGVAPAGDLVPVTDGQWG